MMFRFRNISLVLVLLGLTVAQSAQAQTTYYSRQTGNWSSNTTWSTVGFGGAAAASVPLATDNVQIRSDHTVTLDLASATSASLTIVGAASTGGLLLNGNSLNVTGNAIINNSTANGTNASVDAGSGTLTVDGTLTMNGASANNTRLARLVIGTGSATITGGITFDGTAAARKVILFQATGTLTTPALPTGGTLTSFAGSTVIINGSLTNSLVVATFANLQIDKTGGTLSLGGNATVNEDLTITQGTLTVGAFTLTVTGTTTLSGTMNITSATGVKTFGNLLIDSGTMSFTVAEGITMNGNLQVDGTGTITGTQGTWTFQKSGGGGTLSGTATSTTLTNATFTTSYAVSGTYVVSGTLTVTGTTLTNNGTLTATTALSGTGGLTQGSGASLTIGGTSTITTLDASASPNTVSYSGGGAQTVKSTTYHHLTFPNAGTKTAGGAITVNGDLTISGTVVLADGGFQIMGNASGAMTMGAWTGLTLGTTTAATSFPTNYVGANITLNVTSTVTYNSNVAQTISSVPAYGNLTLVATAAVTKTLDGALTINGNLTNGVNNTLDVSASDFAIDLAGNWSAATGSVFTAGAGTVTFNGSGPQQILGTLATKAFNDVVINKGVGTLLNTAGGTTVTVSDLTMTQGDFTPPATLNITGTLTLTAGTLTAGTNINVGGDWTNNGGTFTPGAGTVTFNSTTAGQSINGTAVTQTFNNITVNKTGQVLSVGGSTTTLTVNGGFTLTAGSFTAPPTLTVSGAVTLTAGTLTAGTDINVGGNWSAATASTFTAGTGTVTFNGSGAQSITGTLATKTFYNVEVNKSAGTLSGAGGTTTVSVNNLTMTQGNFTPPPTLNITGTLTLTAGTLTAGTNINIGGDWTNNGGTFTPGAGTVTFNSTTAGQSINGSAATQTFNNLTVNKTGQTLSVGGSTTSLTVNGGFTLTAGDFAAPPTMTITGATTLTAGTFTAGTTINSAGNWTNNGGTFIPGSGTVNFTSTTAAQSINGTAVTQTFNNITVNKTGQTLSVGGSTTTLALDGNLDISAGTFSVTGISLTVNGTTSITGTLTFATSAAGTKAFVGLVTINAGGLWTNPINESITFQGGLTHNGTTFTSGTGIYTFDTNPQSIGGSTALTISNLTVTGVTLTNTSAIGLTVSTALAGTGDLTNATNAILNISGTSTITTLDASASPNTVSYSGGGAQTVKSTTYHHLTFPNAGTKTAGGAITVNGDLTISGTVVLADGGFQITGNATGGMTMGAWTGLTLGTAASATSYPTNYVGANITLNVTSTVTYNSNLTQTISSVPTYGNLTLVATAAVTKTLDGALTINGNLTIGVNNTLDVSASNFAIDLAGNWSAATGSVFTARAGTVTFNGSGAQQILGTLATKTFNDVVINKGVGTLLNAAGGTTTVTVNSLTMTQGNFTPPATLNITGTLTLTAGTLTAGTNINVGGDWTNNGGTFTPGAGTVTFNSTTAGQSINGSAVTQTFNNITVNKTGQTLSVGGSTTTLVLNGGFTLTAGSFTAPPTLTVSGAVTLTAGTLTAGTDINIGGNWSAATASTFTAGTSTVTFNGSGAQQILGTLVTKTFNDVVINKGVGTLLNTAGGTTTVSVNNLTMTQGNFTPPATLNTTGTLTLTTGTLTAGTNINVGGDWTNNGGTFTPGIGTRTVNFVNTTAAQAINGTAVTQTFNNIIVNKTGQTLSVGGSTTTLVLNSNLTLSAGIFSAGTATTIDISGNWTNNGGTFNPGTSTVTFSSGTAQAINGTALTQTFNNVTVSKSGNTLSVGGSTTTLALNGAMTLASGTFSAGTATAISIVGNWTNDGGTFTPGASTVSFNGTAGSQAINGTALAHSFNGLTLNNSNGLTLAANVTVNGPLTFTSGNITTAANRIAISSTGSVVRTSGHVVGNLEKNVATGATTRTFEIGDASNYTPVQISFASVTTAGLLAAYTTPGDHPDIANSPVDETQSVNRYWAVTNSGVAFTTYDATFTFVPGDVDIGADPNEFIVGKLDGTTWSQPTVGTHTATSTQATGMSSFSEFVVGLSNTKTWDGGAGTNNWGDAANWNPNGVPRSSTDVLLTGANTINVNVAALGKNVTLSNSSLTLTILAGNSLSASSNLMLTSGTLNTENGFPTVSGTITIAGGTVGYTGAGNQAVVLLSYNNLTFGNAGTKTFAAGTTQISGNFAVVGAAAADATTNNTTIEFSSGAAQDFAGITYYNLTMSGAGTKSASGNVAVNNNFSNAATTSMGLFTLSIGGTKTNSGTMQFAGPTNGIVFADGTVEYNGSTVEAPAGQTIAAGTYASLVISNTAEKIVLSGSTVHTQASLTVPSNTPLTVQSTATLQVDLDLNLIGPLTNEGTINVGN